jgi:hypothetical protein
VGVKVVAILAPALRWGGATARILAIGAIKESWRAESLVPHEERQTSGLYRLWSRSSG